MKKTLLYFALSILVVSPVNLAFSKNLDNNRAKPNQFWWPEQLDLSVLRSHSAQSNPLSKDFDYAKEFESLDLEAVKNDLNRVLTDSQDWWPADYGNYGPLFIRMAWHSAGTYRNYDGRGGADGGQQRFSPLNSWPDNGNLDKARRLLWPVKKKYGQKISWSDLIILAGNVALENMGFKTLGFAGGRIDDWEADLVYWGPEAKFLGDRRHQNGKLKKPLAATQMGLIYVNPEGPGGNSDPLASARDIRTTFARMAMNDQETVALIAGGHAFGKAHGAHNPTKCLGPEPAAAGIEEQGLGWKNKCGKGKAEDTVTGNLEGAWTTTPTKWSITYLENLFKFEWKQVKSPAGGIQWIPTNTDPSVTQSVPDAHLKDRFSSPMMLTSDLALKFDPSYRKIAKGFLENQAEFELAFAKAWFKLTHRDLGPRSRYLGSDIPDLKLIWQDPIPAVNHKLVNSRDLKKLKKEILNSGLTVPQLVKAAWASAASFRATDLRGGSNGGRINLDPQKEWRVNDPEELKTVLNELSKIQISFNKNSRIGKKISLADMVVLGGAAAIEQAAQKAGYQKIEVPLQPGRMDALQAETDLESFALLKPKTDGFRNYYGDSSLSPAEALVDKASTLNLSVPEMTVLVGGMRALAANTGNSKHGILTDRPGSLTNDFFINLLDFSTAWKKSPNQASIYEGYDRKTGEVKWTATPVDLIFGSNSELRAVAEVYASDDAEEKFVNDFVSAWVKVMNLGR